MISAFELAQGRLKQIHIDTVEDLRVCRPVWVDLVEPSEEERTWVLDVFGLDLPEEDEVGDIEASARFFERDADNGDELHIRSDFFRVEEHVGENVRVAFILKNSVLFSIHAEDLPQFRLLRLRARRQPDYVEDEKDVLLEMFAADAEYSADVLEGIYKRLDAFGEKVLGTHLTDENAGDVLGSIAREEDLNGHIRRNLMDTRRAASFLLRNKMLNAEQNEDVRQILRDIDSLDGHTAFLFEKLNFLMDATVGFININQNKIVKIFSVASVALLPPTLIASIYGMNFRAFPELDWAYGYPFSLALMVVSVIIPFWYFRRKGWLR
ncbi:MAG: magnesium/cobalt transporter CorA [Deltaproteobacteria bacterium]|nr:MAG: magnesium/cobalt transporter CorA [Deltaproteobacteria bacterium]